MKMKKVSLIFFLFFFSRIGLALDNPHFSGELSVAYSDDFEGGNSEKKFFLHSFKTHPHDYNDSEIELKFKDKNLKFSTNDKLEIKCLSKKNKTCEVEEWNKTEEASEASLVAPSSLETLWIIVDIADRDVALTNDQVIEKIHATENWYEQASFGKTTINADLDNDGYDLHRVRLTDYSTANGCDQATLRKSALAALTADGVDITRHKYRVFLIPQLGCSFGGLGTIGCGKFCWSVIHAITWDLAYTHELGHNIKLHHAATDQDNDGVYNSEYGDGSCPMGNIITLGHFNGPHTHMAGWVDELEGTYQTIQENTGTYSIRPMSSSSEGVKVYQFTRDKTYTISYRQLSDFEKLQTKFLSGISLHSEETNGHSLYIGTFAPGKSYSIGELTINSLSASADEATFSINDCSTNTKPFTITPLETSYQGFPGDEVQLTYKIENKLATACPSISINLNQQATDELQGVLSHDQVTLNSGETTDVSISVVAPSETRSYDIGLQGSIEGSGTFVTALSTLSILDPQNNFSPGVKRYHYSGTWDQLPNFSTLESDAIATVDSIDIGEFGGTNRFALRFEGYIYLAAGTYTFRLDSDDGSRLILNNNVLINHDGLHSKGSPKQAVFVAEEDNYYPFELQYFEKSGKEALLLNFKKDDGAFEELPADIFYHLKENESPLEPVLAYTQTESPIIDGYDTVFQMSVPHCFKKPLPFARLQTRTGEDPGVLEVNFVGCNEANESVFDLHFKEFEYLDKVHPQETVGLLVVEEGVFRLEDGTLVVAQSLDANNNWQDYPKNIIFQGKEYVFLTQVLESAQASPKLTRIKETTDFVRYKLTFEEALQKAGERASAKIALLTLSTSSDSTWLTQSLSTNQSWFTLSGLPQDVTEATYFSNLSSHTGTDPSYSDVKRLSFESLDFHVQEEASNDAEVNHTIERIDLIFFPSKDGVHLGSKLL